MNRVHINPIQIIAWAIMPAAECLEYDSESCPLLKKEQTSQQSENLKWIEIY